MVGGKDQQGSGVGLKPLYSPAFLQQHGSSPFCAITHWRTTSRWPTNSLAEPLIRSEAWREVDIKDRRYRRGKSAIRLPCQKFREIETKTLQARYVQGSVDDIRRSLEWAGLEYDYGKIYVFVPCFGCPDLHTFQGPERGGPHAPYFQVRQYTSAWMYTHSAHQFSV